MFKDMMIFANIIVLKVSSSIFLVCFFFQVQAAFANDHPIVQIDDKIEEGTSDKPINKDSEQGTNKGLSLRLIIGGTPGIYKFGESWLTDVDDGAYSSRMKSIKSVFVEWYVINNFGIGINLLTFGTYGIIIGHDSKIEKDEIFTDFYTAQWIPVHFGNSTINNINVGFLIGYSPNSSYKRKRLTEAGKRKDDLGLESLEEDDFEIQNVKGTAEIYKGFAEYEFYSHGFRLSLFTIVTHFDKFKDGTRPSGNGYGYYISYRYAFSL